MFGRLFGKKKEVTAAQYIENDLGKFVKKQYGRGRTLYEGMIDWCDKEYDVEACVICAEEHQEIQSINFAYLGKILEDKESLDKKLKYYIADEQVEADELVHIWGDGESDEEPAPITREAFISLLHLSYIRIYEDATAEFVFPVDGIFTDHELVVRADHNLDFTECYLEG